MRGGEIGPAYVVGQQDYSASALPFLQGWHCNCFAGPLPHSCAMCVLVKPLAGECAWAVQGSGEYHCGTASATVWGCAVSRLR